VLNVIYSLIMCCLNIKNYLSVDIATLESVVSIQGYEKVRAGGEETG
jgi:hypothetical protein